MRKTLLFGGVLGLLNATIALVGAHLLSRSGTYGWYAYSPMPSRYADYLPSRGPYRWAAVAVVVAAFVVVNAAVVAGFVTYDRRRRRAQQTV